MAERNARKIKKSFAFSALKNSDGEFDDGLQKTARNRLTFPAAQAIMTADV